MENEASRAGSIISCTRRRWKKTTESPPKGELVGAGFCISLEGKGIRLVTLPAHSQDFQVLACGQCLEKGLLSPAQSRA